MARPATIENPELLKKLSDVFRAVGYEGASLATLATAAGLQKASLYHRFPGGKEQMAGEVMGAAEKWLTEQILVPLKSSGPARARIHVMVRNLDEFYSGGRQACLLNMLSSPHGQTGPFARPIKKAFKAWVEALATVVSDAGFDETTAYSRAQRAIALFQGSLVLARGMGTTQPFQTCLANLEGELLAPTTDSTRSRRRG